MLISISTLQDIQATEHYEDILTKWKTATISSINVDCTVSSPRPTQPTSTINTILGSLVGYLAL